MERKVFQEQPEEERQADANAFLQTLSLEVRGYVKLCWEAEDPNLNKQERKAKHAIMGDYLTTILSQPERGAIYREELARYGQERNLQLEQERKQ